ncbi:hypothetical protein DNTS_015953, partial [Danionella cerebrum]
EGRKEEEEEEAVVGFSATSTPFRTPTHSSLPLLNKLNMASGVAIDAAVAKTYEEIKVRLQGADERERFKLVIMRLSDDQKSIIVDLENSLKVKDVENEANVFEKIINKLPNDDCRYALYDCKYENLNSLKEDLVFIFSAPEEAPLRNKMVYSSSKTALKLKLPGLKFEWQINDQSDKDALNLVAKLGGPKTIKTLEGKPLKP